MSRLFGDAVVLVRWAAARAGVETVGEPLPFRTVAEMGAPGEMKIRAEEGGERLLSWGITEEHGPVNGWGITFEGELMWWEEVGRRPMMPGERLTVAFTPKAFSVDSNIA